MKISLLWRSVLCMGWSVSGIWCMHEEQSIDSYFAEQKIVKQFSLMSTLSGDIDNIIKAESQHFKSTQSRFKKRKISRIAIRKLTELSTYFGNLSKSINELIPKGFLEVSEFEKRYEQLCTIFDTFNDLFGDSIVEIFSSSISYMKCLQKCIQLNLALIEIQKVVKSNLSLKKREKLNTTVIMYNNMLNTLPKDEDEYAVLELFFGHVQKKCILM